VARRAHLSARAGARQQASKREVTTHRRTENRLLNRQEAQKRKLAGAGIVYNFDKVGYVSVSAAIPWIRSTFCFIEKAKKHVMTTYAVHVVGYRNGYGGTFAHPVWVDNVGHSAYHMY